MEEDKLLHVEFRFRESVFDFYDDDDCSIHMVNCIENIDSIYVNGERVSAAVVDNIVFQSLAEVRNNIKNDIDDSDFYNGPDIKYIMKYTYQSEIDLYLPIEEFDYRKLCLIPIYINFTTDEELDDTSKYQSLLKDGPAWSLFRVIYGGLEYNTDYDSYNQDIVSSKKIWRVK